MLPLPLLVPLLLPLLLALLVPLLSLELLSVSLELLPLPELLLSLLLLELEPELELEFELFDSEVWGLVAMPSWMVAPCVSRPLRDCHTTLPAAASAVGTFTVVT